ncbi:MAG TPA: acetyl-CoA carboxylase biotin carboxyl carrier protein subunit [Vicinamibacterales bacterium]|nr:acetyl-CoA carboxylase biotin carboxyl carrier protein subunit [Vicinamibacterales bacterium]
MHFDIEVAGRAHRVTVERQGTQYRIEADGRVDLVDVARVDPSTWSLIVLGDRHASHEVGLLEGREPGEVEVYTRAGLVRTRVRTGTGRRRGGAAAAPVDAGGPQAVTAPMPGKIVKVLVAAGDTVRARQGLVVIEAMKMENELRAPRDGRVAAVHVQEGALVEAGRLLVVIG